MTLPAPPLPHPVPGPATLPARPRGPFASAVTDFWAGHRRDVPSSTLLLCALAGLAGGAALVGSRLGLGAAVVAALIWAAAVPVLVRRRAIGDLVTAALSVGLVAVVALVDAGWVMALCVTTAAAAGGVASTSARSGPAVLLSGVSWAATAFRALPWVGRRAGSLLGARRTQALLMLRSVAVTVVLVVVFGMLFASADTVFASYLGRVDLAELPARVVVGLLVALAAAAMAHGSLAPPGWSALGLAPGRPAQRAEWLLPVLALGVLVLAFVLVQVGALLGGHRHVLETAGLGYAEYARQGFAQLVVATALTLVVVAVAARKAPRGTRQDRVVSRGALGLLCLGTLGVVASALRRLDLYVEAFGLTRLRVLVAVVEIVLAVVLVLVVVAGVRWRGAWLPRAVVQVVAVAVLALAAVNPDGLVVRHNVAADLVVPLDVRYLQGLSADAVPAIDRLDEPLRSCVLERLVVAPIEGWAEWNLSRVRAAETLRSGKPVDGVACGQYAGSSGGR
ncbi:MAG: hypothetical protein JWP95_274 [Actinotalea sp.]|nr:hypothetical protein [Actinotalea sp.]